MFFRSSLSVEVHQLHQLHCQLIFVKTYSDKESSDGFIKANQKKTEAIEGNSPNHIKFIKLCSRNGGTFFRVNIRDAVQCGTARSTFF